MPNTIFILIIFFVFTILLYYSSTKKRVNLLFQKKSRKKLIVDLKISKNNLKIILAELTKCYNFRIEAIDDENSQYIFSDQVSLFTFFGFFTFGSFYLIELNEDSIELYTIPRYFLEQNRFGIFETKLNRLGSLIQILDRS